MNYPLLRWKNRTIQRIIFDITRITIPLVFLCGIILSVDMFFGSYNQSNLLPNIKISNSDYHKFPTCKKTGKTLDKTSMIQWNCLNIIYPINWRYHIEKYMDIDMITLHPNTSPMYGIYIWITPTDNEYCKRNCAQGHFYYQMDYFSHSKINMRADCVSFSLNGKNIQFVCFAPSIYFNQYSSLYYAILNRIQASSYK